MIAIDARKDDTETIARLLVARLGFDYDDLEPIVQALWIMAACFYMRKEFDDE